MPEFCSFGTIYILLSISDCETIHPLPFLSSNNYSTRQCARVHAGQDKQIKKCGRSCQFWGLGHLFFLINTIQYHLNVLFPSYLSPLHFDTSLYPIRTLVEIINFALAPSLCQFPATTLFSGQVN